VTALECIDCAKLPYLGEEEPGYVGAFRPRVPRRLHPSSGPRSPRCATHVRAKKKAGQQRSKELRQEKVYELTPELLAGLEAYQGWRCPCGNQLKDTDHDHEIARRKCSHPPKQGCKTCLRGRLCASCNRDILGRGYTAARLRALADYLDDPPAPRFFAGLSQLSGSRPY